MSKFTSDRIYLNEHIQTYNFTPEQMRRVEELSKKYNMCEAILLTEKCHCCGKGLTSANEFCSDFCKEYCDKFPCLWGLECVFCKWIPIEKCDCHICCIDDNGPANLFNREHGTTYGKSEFELLQEYANKTGMDLLTATECSKKCRDCEEKLEFTMNYGQEYCNNCKIKYVEEKETEIINANICFWGKDCDRCAEMSEDERNNSFVKECVECKKTMTDPTKSWMLASQLDHEGYGENDDGGGIICNLCAAGCDFDEQEII